MKLKKVVIAASIAVFAICAYAFLLGNDVFEGDFANDAIAWYFLAKGIFCSLALYFLYLILDAVRSKSDSTT